MRLLLPVAWGEWLASGKITAITICGGRGFQPAQSIVETPTVSIEKDQRNNIV